MAKRRVKNDLFDFGQSQDLINIADPGFLKGVGIEDDGIEAIDEIDGGLPAFNGVNKDVPPVPVQDARQIPLKQEAPDEESGLLSSLGDYFTKGLQTIGSARSPEQDDEYNPQDIEALGGFANADLPQEDAIQAMGGEEVGNEDYANIGNLAGQEPQEQKSKSFKDYFRPYTPGVEPQQGDNTSLDFLRPYTPGVNQPEGGLDDRVQSIPASQDEFVQRMASGEPPERQDLTEEEITASAQEGGQPVSGAIDMAEQNPYIMDELARLNGIGQMPPELVQYAKEWEDALTKQKDQLSAREKALVSKMETGALTDFDKIGIALAVAVPAIMGLMYGGAAFALSAGGALQAVGAHQKSQEDTRKKAREELETITKDKVKLTEDGVKLKQDILSKIPDKEVKTYLKSKKVREFGDDLGIGMGDENKMLWMNSGKISDNEDLKKVKERTKDAEELIGDVGNFNKALNDVEEIILAIQDQDPGVWNILRSDYKFLENNSPDKLANSTLGDVLSMMAKVPGVSGKKVELDIVGRDGKVKKVNALDALQQSVKALQNNYNTAVLKGSRLTENVMKHWSGIMFDPTSATQFLSAGTEGWAENARNLRNIMNRKIQEELVGYGFIRDPIQEAFPVQERQILRSVNSVNKDIMQNPDAYKNKVR
jgi:hypothetical protein